MDRELRELHRSAEEERWRMLHDPDAGKVTVACDGCGESVLVDETAVEATHLAGRAFRCPDCREESENEDDDREGAMSHPAHRSDTGAKPLLSFHVPVEGDRVRVWFRSN